jgi:hypothetical protein
MTAAEELDELIDDTAAKADGDPTYLGSEPHRLDLKSYAQKREQGIDVHWGADSAWEPAVIYLQNPGGTDGERRLLAEGAALVTLHETLHERYSQPQGKESVYKRLKKFKDTHHPAACDFLLRTFNWIEDERISRAEAEVTPDLDPALARFGALVLEQWELMYAARHQEPPWSVAPASKAEQFVVALAELVFGRGRRSQLHPDVEELIEDCIEPIGKATSPSSSFFDSCDAAFAVFDLYAANVGKLVQP